MLNSGTQHTEPSWNMRFSKYQDRSANAVKIWKKNAVQLCFMIAFVMYKHHTKLQQQWEHCNTWMQMAWILAMFCKSPFHECHISSLVMPLFWHTTSWVFSYRHPPVVPRSLIAFGPLLSHKKSIPSIPVQQFKRTCLVADLGKNNSTLQWTNKSPFKIPPYFDVPELPYKKLDPEKKVWGVFGWWKKSRVHTPKPKKSCRVSQMNLFENICLKRRWIKDFKLGWGW